MTDVSLAEIDKYEVREYAKVTMRSVCVRERGGRIGGIYLFAGARLTFFSRSPPAR